MRRAVGFCLLLLALVCPSISARAAFGRSAGLTSERTTIVIRPDGTCLVTNNSITPRASIEGIARFWQQYRNMAESDDDDETHRIPKPAETKPFTDPELADAIRNMVKQQAEDSGDEVKLETLDISSNAVHMAATRTFPAVRDMLQRFSQLSGQSGPGVQSARFETTNGLLRVTLGSYPNADRYAKRMREQWKLSGAKAEWKLILPGKIVSSDLPHRQDNATWIAIDAEKEDTLDAAIKMYSSPAVITAELAGLKLDEPLDSKTLQRSYGRSNGATDDLPVTDAGPGFAAEPLSITTSAIHYFPEGEKNLQAVSAFTYEPTGTVVEAKLFAPKGRSIRGVGGTRVLKAIDDKGRTINAAENDDQGMQMDMHTFSSGSQDPVSTQIQLRFGMPQGDAQSIDELTAETIALTVGKWKTFTVTNLLDNQELDLGSVLPGARLTVTKSTVKDGQVKVQAKIVGPKTIRSLDVKCKMRGNDEFNSNASERKFTTAGAESTRTLSIQGYAFDSKGLTDKSLLSLLVRYPEDLRRERVQFKLSGLDLF